MKAQHQIAMALTIVLSLAAGAVLVWQFAAHPAGNNNSVSNTAEDSATLFEETVESPEPVVTEADERRADAAAIFPRNINRVCKNGFTIERNSAGDSLAFSCNSSAYENYSTEALESLAYGDAEAASILAYRLRHSDYPRALRLAIRAAALSGGDVGTLISATSWRPLQDENGDPSLSGFAQAYVLHSLIEKVRSSSYRMPGMYETNIRRISDKPDEMLDDLDDIVDRLMDDARQIELDVIGNSTIGGDGDV